MLRVLYRSSFNAQVDSSYPRRFPPLPSLAQLLANWISQALARCDGSEVLVKYVDFVHLNDRGKDGYIYQLIKLGYKHLTGVYLSVNKTISISQ